MLDAAPRGVDGAAVWLRAGAVGDDVPDLLLWTSKGDEAHVERLRDVLYNADQPPAAAAAGRPAAGSQHHVQCPVETTGPWPAESAAPPSQQPQQRSQSRRQEAAAAALVPAADLEHLLLAILSMVDSDDGAEMATTLCSAPAAGELSGTAVLDLIKGARRMNGSADLVSALGRLPGAAEMPLDKVPGLLPGGDAKQWLWGDNVLEPLLEMPRVQQAITGDVADGPVRFAVKSVLNDDRSSMFEDVRRSVAFGLVTSRGLVAAMEECWEDGTGWNCYPEELWRGLWWFPAAEQMSAEQLHDVLLTAITHECGDPAIEQVADKPFVQRRVNWPGLLQAVAHELRTTSSDRIKQVLREQLVWLVPWQAEERTISRSQATELLQAVL